MCVWLAHLPMWKVHTKVAWCCMTTRLCVSVQLIKFYPWGKYTERSWHVCVCVCDDPSPLSDSPMGKVRRKMVWCCVMTHAWLWASSDDLPMGKVRRKLVWCCITCLCLAALPLGKVHRKLVWCCITCLSLCSWSTNLESARKGGVMLHNTSMFSYLPMGKVNRKVVWCCITCLCLADLPLGKMDKMVVWCCRTCLCQADLPKWKVHKKMTWCCNVA